MRTAHIQFIGIFLFVGMLISCGSETKSPEKNAEIDSEQELTDDDLSHADEMIRQMPSPIEMAILIKHAGGEYNAALLNDVKKISDYVTNEKKTINLGIYSSDVGYTSLYKQTQETVFYLNNVRILSDAIGLSDAFDQALFERVEANIENRDSLLHILSGANQAANEYLKNNNRMSTSILMMAGGWIESMYLAANLGVDGNRPEAIISLRILEQEEVLAKIIKTMKMVGDDAMILEFSEKLVALNKVLIAKDLRIGEGDEATVDQEKMMEVFNLIDEIRAWAVA